MRTPVALLIAVALLAAGVAGCSDSDVDASNSYVSAVNAAQTEFSETSERLQAEITPGETAGNERAFERFYGAVDDFVAELRKIEAPPAVRALHERLIATMVRFGDNLRSAGSKITSGSASRILDGQEQLAEASGAVARRLNATIKAINSALQG